MQREVWLILAAGVAADAPIAAFDTRDEAAAALFRLLTLEPDKMLQIVFDAENFRGSYENRFVGFRLWRVPTRELA